MARHNLVVTVQSEEIWNVQDHMTNWDENDNYLLHRHLWVTYVGMPMYSP